MPEINEIKAQIEKARIKNPKKVIQERIDSLPEEFKEGAKLFNKAYDSLPSEKKQQEINDKKEELITFLDTVSPDERKKFFSVFAPKLTDYLEAAWQKTKKLPYNRILFRSNDPTTTIQSRLQLIETYFRHLPEFDQDIIWLAQMAPYTEYHYFYSSNNYGLLLGCAIDIGGAEGSEVKKILTASAKGEHETGVFGSHIIQAFLSTNDKECHQIIAGILAKAQREEDIRNYILNEYQYATTEAALLLFKTIADNNLVRFNSIAGKLNYAIFGIYDESDGKRILKAIRKILDFAENEDKRKSAIQFEKGEDLYLALWTAAFLNVVEILDVIERILEDPDPERRYPVVHLLNMLGLEISYNYGIVMLQDPDLRIVVKAMHIIAHRYAINIYFNKQQKIPEEYSPIFEHLHEKFPSKAVDLPPIVWEWNTQCADIQEALVLYNAWANTYAPEKIIEKLNSMDASSRHNAASVLSTHAKKGGVITDAIFDLMGDASATVRGEAFRAAKYLKINESQAKKMETLLKRKPADLRQAVITALTGQDINAALHSAERLINSKDKMQRIGGLELLKKLAEKGISPEICKDKASLYLEKNQSPGKEEINSLEAILGVDLSSLSNDGSKSIPAKPAFKMPDPEDHTLGLLEGLDFPLPKMPRKTGAKIFTPATLNFLKSLSKFIDKNKLLEVKFEDSNNKLLLGEIKWGFPGISQRITIEENLAKLPLKELWETWWKERPENTRDEDGFELLRAAAYPYIDLGYWDKMPDKSKFFLESLGVEYKKELPYQNLIERLLNWFIILFPIEGAIDFLMDALEESIMHVRPEWCTAPQNKPEYEYGRNHSWLYSNFSHTGYNKLISDFENWFSDKLTYNQNKRLWDLRYWLANPMFEKDGKLTSPKEWLEEKHQKYCEPDGVPIDQHYLIRSFKKGYANERELIRNFAQDFRAISGRDFIRKHKDSPALLAIVEKFRNRILDIEIRRGEDKTAATGFMGWFKYAGGIDRLASFLGALGEGRFVRNESFSDERRNYSFTKIIKATFPPETEDYEFFEKRISEEKIPEKLLVETAMLAPQWAGYIEKYLGWKGFKSAVFWFHAHTKDDQWSTGDDFYETWKAEINTYTPLDENSLKDGAVDAEWFIQVYSELGQTRWDKIDEAGKFASSGNGHARARIFAGAMTGKTGIKEIMGRISGKRNQDALRALGLIPLPEGKNRDTEIFERYEVIQEFLRTTKQFGAQRQASEKRAVAIAMENLARTGGYPDPIRLEWAMETKAVGNLAEGALKVQKENYTFILEINSYGEPEFTVMSGEKVIKSVPAAYKKDEDVVALRNKATELKKQVSRIRKSLEEAMIRQDTFTLDEVAGLSRHPILSAFFRKLVLTGQNITGLPGDDGKSLMGPDGERYEVPETASLRIAHSYDLLNSGKWDVWQKYFFSNKIKQPFRQVFRELYVLTEAEKQTKGSSPRYNGHNVQSQKTVAILGKRGWVIHPEEGLRKNLHRENLTVYLNFSNYYYFYSGENEVWAIDTVVFTERGKWEPVFWDKVSPITFSEVMRDVDLVVSVAHSENYNPEATMSTVEMRLALVRETCSMLCLTNVEVTDNRVLIYGKLGEYSVHPGSAAVHKMPGGHICIIPVESQKMDRVFLPFADSDPKTAELISKVLLLAEDGKIKSPHILQQITR